MFCKLWILILLELLKGSFCIKVDNLFGYNIYVFEIILFIVISKCCV